MVEKSQVQLAFGTPKVIKLSITSRMSLALKNAGFKERKCIKGFAERGYIQVSEENGKPCYQPSRSIEGHSVRVYVLNLPRVKAQDEDQEEKEEKEIFSD